MTDHPNDCRCFACEPLPPYEDNERPERLGTRTDVADRARDVIDCSASELTDGTDWIEAADQSIRDLLAEVERLRDVVAVESRDQLLQLVAERNNYSIACEEVEAENECLRARVVELEEALRPFADAALDGETPIRVTMAHCRHAREALARSTG